MRRAWQVVRLALRLLPVVLVLAIVVPGSGVRPTTLSLAKIEKAQGYDAGSDVVWVLVLGSDAPPNEPPTSGDTDAFQLLAIDARTGAAAGIGIPRDSYVDLHGDLGPSRINIALKEGMERDQGFAVVVRAVEELVGVTPDYVLVTSGDGFTDMFDTLGGRVEVDSTVAFTTPEGLVVEKGVNEFTAAEALQFAEFRDFPGQGDLTRSANHQALLLGLLKELQRRDDRHGFVETMAVAALDGIATEDVSPLDLYRLLNLLTSVDPALVEGCIVTGKDVEDEAGNMVIDPDEELAQRLGREAADDATFETGAAVLSRVAVSEGWFAGAEVLRVGSRCGPTLTTATGDEPTLITATGTNPCGGQIKQSPGSRCRPRGRARWPGRGGRRAAWRRCCSRGCARSSPTG